MLILITTSMQMSVIYCERLWVRVSEKSLAYMQAQMYVVIT